MQSVSSRIWTRVAVSISYDDNHYTSITGTSITIRLLNVISRTLVVRKGSFLSVEKQSLYSTNFVCIYVCKSKVKLATIVEGDPKAPFSIATTPRGRGGRYSFPGLLYFTLDPYLIMLSVKQGGIKYHFLSLWYDLTWDWTQVSRAIGEHSKVTIFYGPIEIE